HLHALIKRDDSYAQRGFLGHNVLHGVVEMNDVGSWTCFRSADCQEDHQERTPFESHDGRLTEQPPDQRSRYARPSGKGVSSGSRRSRPGAFRQPPAVSDNWQLAWASDQTRTVQVLPCGESAISTPRAARSARMPSLLAKSFSLRAAARSASFA